MSGYRSVALGLTILLLALAVLVKAGGLSSPQSRLPRLRLIPPVTYVHPAPGSSRFISVCVATGRSCRVALLAEINADRAAVGAPPLVLSAVQSWGSGSCVGSVGHSRAMAGSGSIWHDDPAYPDAGFWQDICIGFTTAGENVGVASGASRYDAMMQIHQDMMTEPYSPGCTGNHHCSLLSVQYRTIGIAFATAQGATYLTEDFTG